jgi:uncharacterized protein YdeI (YjbR/CyaY-like superfamily)
MTPARPDEPRPPLPEPSFFETPEAFRDWLQANAASTTELQVGFRKVGSGLASMSWSASVDEALCFGWIDGVRKRIDDSAYTVRFTPRKPNSIWSAVNIAKVDALRQQGRMTPAGERAFALRSESKSRVYSHEQAASAELSAPEQRAFQRDKAAWAFFERTPPSYKKALLHWVASAKKAETRASRLAALIGASAEGRRLR